MTKPTFILMSRSITALIKQKMANLLVPLPSSKQKSSKLFSYLISLSFSL